MYIKNFRKSVLNLGMLLAVGITFGIMFRTFFTCQFFQNYKMIDIVTMHVMPMALSSYLPFACVFPMLPYGLTLIEEVNSGYDRLIIQRMGINNYIKNKIFFNTIAGGLAAFLPILLIFIGINILGTEVDKDNISDVFLTWIWSPVMLIWGGRFVLLIKLVLGFLFGAIWANVELMMAAVTKNKYASFVVPFVLYQACWLLLPDFINPAVLMRGDFFDNSVPIWYPIVVQIFFLMLIVCMCEWFMKRMYKE